MQNSRDPSRLFPGNSGKPSWKITKFWRIVWNFQDHFLEILWVSLENVGRNLLKFFQSFSKTTEGDAELLSLYPLIPFIIIFLKFSHHSHKIHLKYWWEFLIVSLKSIPNSAEIFSFAWFLSLWQCVAKDGVSSRGGQGPPWQLIALQAWIQMREYSRTNQRCHILTTV